MTPTPALRDEHANLASHEPLKDSYPLRDLAQVGRLFRSIRSHWKVFVGVFAGFVALVTIGTLLVPKQYTATVKMIIGGTLNRESAAERYSTLPVLNALTLQSSDLSADTIAELVQEGPVLDQVISTLNLNQSRGELLSHVSVKPVVNTAILTLSVRWKDPQRAAEIANTFSTAFVARERELIGSQAVAAQTYLQQAISKAQISLQQANRELSTYEAGSQITDITAQTQALLARMEAAESKIEQLVDDQKQAQAQLASAQSQLAQLPTTIAGQEATDVNPASIQLRNQLADVEVQLASARRKYTEEHPTVIALEHQRTDLMRQLAAQPGTVPGQAIAVPNPVYQQLAQQSATLRGQIQGDTAQIAALRAQRKAMQPEIAALPAQTAKLGFLQERAKLAQDVYTSLSQKYDDAVVAANSAISDVSVVQAATADDTSVSPNLTFNVLASIVIGMILATLAVVMIDLLARRIREEDDVAVALGMPVIARIPDISGANQRSLPWLQTVTIEAFLHLCAALHMRGARSARVVAITSPEQGDGKSTIAFRLATAMSHIRARVVLVDADMRCPCAHVQAGVENAAGLADVLSGTRSFEETVTKISPTLDLLTAGTIPHNPVGLIESNSFDELLQHLRNQYDSVIIDTAALIPAVDSILLAARSDATAIVISAAKSHERKAKDAIATLRAMGIENIVGVILNRTKTNLSDYSDYFATRPRPPVLPSPPAGAATQDRDDGTESETFAVPSLTIVIPAYNEGPALRAHLLELTSAFDRLDDGYAIDYIAVDDGSTDETYEIASEIARERNDMVVLRHERNRGLGAALRTAAEHATGTFVLTVDSDLSYSPEYLIRLVRAARNHDADLVLASAYMKGGRVCGVPWLRAFLSREANRFLSMATGGSFATLTCMVRVYRRSLFNRLSFTADGMVVNADLALQALRAKAVVVEIPATLQWPEQRKRTAGRASLRSLCVLTWHTLVCGIRHRPALALSIPGLIPGLLPFVVAAMVALRLSPREIVIGSVVTMVVQYGSLAIFGGQALAFIRRRNVKPSPALSKAPHAHIL